MKTFLIVSNNDQKFNKNLILLNLREMTNMNTKEIRAALKKYKMVYEELISKFRE